MLHFGDGGLIDKPCRNGGAGNKVGSTSCRQHGKSDGGKRTLNPVTKTGSTPCRQQKRARNAAKKLLSGHADQ
jgi:hypothetical protein